MFKPLSLSILFTVTKIAECGWLIGDIHFLQFWMLGNPMSRCRQIKCLVRTIFLFFKWHFPAVSSCDKGVIKLPYLFYKGTDLSVLENLSYVRGCHLMKLPDSLPSSHTIFTNVASWRGTKKLKEKTITSQICVLF